MDLLEEIEALAQGGDKVALHFYREGRLRKQLDEMMVAATENIVADEAMIRDSYAWFRLSRRKVDEFRDGVTLDALGLPPVLLALAKMMPSLPSNKIHQGWIDSTRDVQLATAAVIGVIAVNDLYDSAQTMAAGRLWQRIHLWATSEQLSMQPMSQILERIDRERQVGRPPTTSGKLQDLLALTGQCTLMFRVGYPTRTPRPSPRHALDKALL